MRFGMVARKERRFGQPMGYTSLHCPVGMRRNSKCGFAAYSVVFGLGLVSYLVGWSGTYTHRVEESQVLGEESKREQTESASVGDITGSPRVSGFSLAEEGSPESAVSKQHEDGSLSVAENSSDNGTGASTALTVASYLSGANARTSDEIDRGQELSASSQAGTSVAANSGPTVSFAGLGEPRISERVRFEQEEGGTYLKKLADGSLVYFTLDTRLQKRAQEVLEKSRVPWGALVALEPRTGKILALADHSTVAGAGTEVALRATFPAASLFKLVTSSAAVEESGLSGAESVHYRGGDWTLTRANFQPNSKSDRKSMTLAQALGKSCNPVFARVALEDLSPSSLERYARSFGFNAPIPFELPVQASHFSVEDDDYSIARTAAGFGEARISPLHAAMLTSAFANSGVMMKPRIVDRVVSPDGRLLYTYVPQRYRQVVLPSTAQTVIQMMKETTENGTARKYFKEMTENRYPDLEVAGKTGTLRGTDPEGTYFWFVGVLPVDDPKLVVAALVIDPGYGGVKGSMLASKLISFYLEEGYLHNENM